MADLNPTQVFVEWWTNFRHSIEIKFDLPWTSVVSKSTTNCTTHVTCAVYGEAKTLGHVEMFYIRRTLSE
jgi:hypothetical protein